MKSIYKKATILLSVLFLSVFFTSCYVEDTIDCGNAEIEIFNNTGDYIYFSTSGSYCRPSDYIEPYGSVIIDYGELHITRGYSEYMSLNYRYNGPGDAYYHRDIEIDDCYTKEYLGD